jgi:malate dehydrogenase (quinone)
MTTPNSSSNPDAVLVGAGIMSVTLAVILKELDPNLKIEIYEVQIWPLPALNLQEGSAR